MTQAISTDLIKNILQNGEIELQGRFMLGSNYTFLVTVRHAGHEIPAVYKPSRGEQPLWDFPENTLALREIAAYVVSEALGWRFVPYTLLREDGPYGPGSLQQFINYNPNYHYFTFKGTDKARLRPVVLFDYLINNADRKGSHILIQKRTRHIFLIDHGLCFHEEDKLRSVVWDFVGETIPAELMADLEHLRTDLTTPNLLGELALYLTPAEIKALDARAENLIANGIFPLPPQDRRAFPYPPL
jgi:uncharacterized repeat protein (TIGR03843 family)